MFNDGFYPSTPALIDKMVVPYAHVIDLGEYKPDRYAWGIRRSLPFKRILEPSAGKGDICLHLIEHYNMEKREFRCCEIEEDLAAIFRAHGLTVVEHDFLQYSDLIRYDFIIMNPPFRNGVDHLLHAWEILADGDIACVLNAETLRNPNSEKRKLLLRIIEEHGRWEEIGQPFLDAERPTDVECAIVWLHKDAEKFFDFTGAQDIDADVNVDEFNANELASANLVEALVGQYEAARALIIERARLHQKLRFYTKNIGTGINSESAEDGKLNEELISLKIGFWRYVFDRTKLGTSTTTQYRAEFMNYVAERSQVSFTVRNVTEVLEKFFYNRHEIVKLCTLEVFDLATSFHDDNKIHVEGWKTNKAYRVNHRIIMPSCVRVTTYASTESWSLVDYSSKMRSFLRDIDIVLCWLNGTQIGEITRLEEVLSERVSAINYNRADYHEILETTHFKIRIFKKGTVHLDFKDKELLARFNQVAAIGKNWMPDFSKEKYYCDGCADFHAHHVPHQKIGDRHYCERSLRAKQKGAKITPPKV